MVKAIAAGALATSRARREFLPDSADNGTLMRIYLGQAKQHVTLRATW